MATTQLHSQTVTRARSRTLDANGDGEVLLEALDDEACRAILSATGDTPLSASELSEACDLPLSTTYRKLDMLTDAGLLSEGIRIRRSGKHASEYRRAVDEVRIAVGTDSGIELTVGHVAAGP